MTSIKELQDIANLLRRDSLESTTSAGSGHPTSCLSCAEILSALFFHQMSYDTKNTNNPNNDEFILSKGHAAPILYASLKRAGCIKENINSLRKLRSNLEGHPVPHPNNWIKIASGSLGQGLSVGVGFALAGKLSKLSYKTYVLLGDSEVSEGSIYEALQLAPKYNLNNLIAILDANRLGQTGPTLLQHNTKEYEARFRSFGWNTLTVDGHNINQLLNALKKSAVSSKPTIIITKTFKGKGVSFLENKEGWHGKVLSKDQLSKALEEIPNPKMPKINIKKPKSLKQKFNHSKLILNKYNISDSIATREAYGKALASLALSDSSVLAIDAEVSNSTHSEEVKKQAPKQFIETYIAEQDMIGIALGLSKKGFKPHASTFSAFLSRAHDQLRMSAISDGNFTICGSHSGVSIGEDGASQMGLEDIAIFRDLPNSIVLYPSDAVSTQSLLIQTTKLKGIKYIRTTRPKTAVIYKSNEKFPLADFKVLKQSNKDKAVLVGSGITLHEALKANALLKNKKIKTAVIDLYCIKPFKEKKFVSFVKKHGNKIIIAEDHYKAGGIGEMLSTATDNTNIKLSHLYISEVPHSGTKDQLLEKYKINWKAYVDTVKKLI